MLKYDVRYTLKTDVIQIWHGMIPIEADDINVHVSICVLVASVHVFGVLFY